MSEGVYQALVNTGALMVILVFGLVVRQIYYWIRKHFIHNVSEPTLKR